jgi:hypothetical protein
LALGEETGEMVPPLLGQDYTVLAGPRPVRPVSLPHQRTDAPAPALPAVPAPAPATEGAPAPEPAPTHASKASNATTAAIATA